MGTWPDTTVESPDGARVAFTLTSGLTPVNPLVMVGGPTGEMNVSPTQFSFVGPIVTLTFAPVLGEIVNVYFTSTGVSLGSPGVTTLGGMRATIRQRADLVASLFVTDPELNGWINSSAQELYDLLIQKYGDEYYVAAVSTFTTDGINDQFALPTDFYKLLGAEWKNQSDYVDLPRFNFSERNQTGLTRRTNLRYRIMGSKIWVRDGSKVPSSGQQVRLWYAPRLSLLVADGDAIDLVSGWEEYIVADCVIKCRQKGEEDPSVEMALKGALQKRIEDAAENRDAGSPQTVSDVRGGEVWAPSWECP